MLGASSGGRRTLRPTASCRRRARARARGWAARARWTARVFTDQARLTPTPRPSPATESLSRTPGARRAGAKGSALAGRARTARARWTARLATLQARPTLMTRSSPAKRISTRSPGARGAGAPAGRARTRATTRARAGGAAPEPRRQRAQAVHTSGCAASSLRGVLRVPPGAKGHARQGAARPWTVLRPRAAMPCVVLSLLARLCPVLMSQNSDSYGHGSSMIFVAPSVSKECALRVRQ
mmetsp:Transcript_58940/g.134830  ORF Transcript_58940/g.134830 Transcript_58940/m.134830 type:complete len:239 (-) Transcript_58940:42-758(-)